MRNRRILLLSAVAVMVLAGLSSSLRAEGGEPVNGLKLTLSAEKPDLRTLANGQVEATKLTLVFTNVSKAPIKLNTYDLTWSLMRFELTGPDGKQVRPATSPMFLARMMAEPTAKNYPTLAPGETWEEKYMPRFPGTHANLVWTLDKPGEYKLKVVYTCTDRYLDIGRDHAKGSWTGTAASNEVVLKVAAEGAAKTPAVTPADAKPDAAAGKTVKNLTLAISADKTELKAMPLAPDRRGRKRYQIEDTSLVLKFTNTGETPINLNLYDIPWRHFWAKVTGPGVEKHMVARTMIWVEPTPKDFATIAPGESHDVKLQFPGGIGETNYVLNSPGTYRITVGYRNDDADNRVSRLAADSWTGSLFSGELVLKVVAKP